jgi:hypothetical protein
MAQSLAKTHQDQLERIKKNVEESRQYFQSNYDRYNQFRRFVFKSTLTDDDITTLQDLDKPILEFNILEPYISRLCGEFSKQEPKMEVHASQDVPVPIDVATVNTVDGLLRMVLDTAQKEGQTYEVFKDLMSGGFSVFDICTEYENEMSFNQIFKLRRVFNPTLTGFDPLAQESHKGDGNYSYALFPRSEEQAKEEFPGLDTSKLKYIRMNAGFNWSFRNQKNTKILLVCDYYEKKFKQEKIVRLSNNMTITKKQYLQLLEMWQQRNIIAVPPSIVNERYTSIPAIHRYTFIEDQVLEHEETDYKFLPHVFVDGNSIKLESMAGGDAEQMTRPYLYNARDIQRLKNFAGQTLANELENMVQHKFKVAEESIPPNYKEAYENVQQADTLVYKAFKDNNPNIPLPPPMEIQRTPIPPEVTNTFSSADQMTQNILGSFDLQMGNLNSSQLSGLAIQESLTQSNAVAMPYVVGYLNALNQVCNVIVDLIPKYYKTPRTIPVLNAEGKRSYARINDPKTPSVPLDYYENALNVTVEAGVNFSVQKSRALQQIIAMMQASPLFAQFMNTEGLSILLDNLEIRGIDQLKVLAQQFAQKMQAQQQAQQNQPNPAMIKLQQEQQKMAQAQQQNQIDNSLRAGEVANDSEANQIKKMQVVLQAQQQNSDIAAQMQKANAENFKSAVDMALKTGDQRHRHSKETVELAHSIISSQQQPSGAIQNAN